MVQQLGLCLLALGDIPHYADKAYRVFGGITQNIHIYLGLVFRTVSLEQGVFRDAVRLSLQKFCHIAGLLLPFSGGDGLESALTYQVVPGETTHTKYRFIDLGNDPFEICDGQAVAY